MRRLRLQLYRYRYLPEPVHRHHNGDIVGKICAETGKSVREVVLERGLLTEAELDDIFSVQNLMHPAYKAKRYTDESEQ